MPDSLTKGTLVRINDHRAGNAAMVDNTLARHGRLWLVDSPILRACDVGWYWCKSIVTGAYFDFHEAEMAIEGGPDQ